MHTGKIRRERKKSVLSSKRQKKAARRECLMRKKTDLLQIRKVMGVLHCIFSLGVYVKVICGKVHNIIKLSKQIGIQAGIRGGGGKRTHQNQIKGCLGMASVFCSSGLDEIIHWSMPKDLREVT